MDRLPYLNKAIGNVLKDLRKHSGLSQRVVADFARSSREQIAQLESGRRGVLADSLYRLAQSFNLTFAELAERIDVEIDRLMQDSDQ